MFGSNVIDILIGLIVVFLSVGLAVSAGTEVVSHWLSMRPKQLKKALIGMLENGSASGTKIEDVHWFFDQTLLRSMADSGKKFPSYMDPKTFSEAILLAIDKDFAGKKADELTTSLEQSLNALPVTEGAKELIRSYIRQSQGDVDQFRKLLEGWFDRVMDRASGWYKRNVAIISLIFAAVIAVSANIDSLAIARALHGSDTLRAKMLDVADRMAKQAPPAAPAAVATGAAPTGTAPPNPTPPADTDIEKSKAQLRSLREDFDSIQRAGLPLGWDGQQPKDWGGWLTKAVGWLITICAATLGAPFWFDMLSKIVNIRNAGPKPETKTDVVSPPVQPGEH